MDTLDDHFQYSMSLAVSLVIYFKGLHSDCQVLSDVLPPYIHVTGPVSARLLRRHIITD